MNDKDKALEAKEQELELEKRRQELISQCKYYKGEKENPFLWNGKKDGALWCYEARWVKFTLQEMDFSGPLKVYKSVGLEDFRKDDGVAMTFKAYLLMRYYFQEGDIPDGAEHFREFYEKYY